MANNYTILVVEDDNSISNFMATVLTSNEYSVIKAEDGKTALSMVTSYCPDLVLLDLGLPDMDGMSILKQVRQWTNIPILVVSARDREREKVEAFDLGADDYITKPFGTSELLARIRALLRRKEKTIVEENIVFVSASYLIEFKCFCFSRVFRINHHARLVIKSFCVIYIVYRICFGDFTV